VSRAIAVFVCTSVYYLLFFSLTEFSKLPRVSRTDAELSLEARNNYLCVEMVASQRLASADEIGEVQSDLQLLVYSGVARISIWDGVKL